MKKVYIPKTPDSGGTEMYGFEYQTGVTATNMHWHSCAELIYVIKTDTRIFFNNRWNTLHEDDMVFIPPRRIHYCRCMDENAVRLVVGIGESVICPDNEKSDELLIPFETERIDDHCIFRNVSRDKIGEKLMLLHEYERKKPSAYMLLSRAILMEIYAYVYSTWEENDLLSETQQNSRIVRNIAKMLQEDIVNAPTAYEMANKLNISYSYMSKLLRDNLSTTYGELINKVRTDEAKKMLLTTDKSVTDIGYDCGFCDSSYFIKIFRRYTGVTPLKYKNNGLYDQKMPLQEKS